MVAALGAPGTGQDGGARPLHSSCRATRGQDSSRLAYRGPEIENETAASSCGTRYVPWRFLVPQTADGVFGAYDGVRSDSDRRSLPVGRGALRALAPDVAGGRSGALPRLGRRRVAAATASSHAAVPCASNGNSSTRWSCTTFGVRTTATRFWVSSCSSARTARPGRMAQECFATCVVGIRLGVAITNPPRRTSSASFQRTDNDTTVITCTRRGAALVNQLCLEVLYIQPAVPLLGRVLADYECNPVNYDETGKLLEQLPRPLDLPLVRRFASSAYP